MGMDMDNELYIRYFISFHCSPNSGSDMRLVSAAGKMYFTSATKIVRQSSTSFNCGTEPSHMTNEANFFSMESKLHNNKRTGLSSKFYLCTSNT